MFEPRVVESVTNECQSLGRAHESSSARAEQLIACLEGEIAKRDARIVELQRAEKNDAIAYKADLERQDELRTERDQQAQRVGELEGLLREIGNRCEQRDMPGEQIIAEWSDQIDAALYSR